MTAPNVNQRLADAHRRLAETQAALKDSTAASEKARGFLAEVGLEVVEHVRRHEALAASRAAALREALKLGGKPSPAEVAPAKDRLQRLEAEDRQAVAKRVLHDLVAEEQAAQREVDEATAELNAAARSVIGAEVDAIVAKINDLERQSMTARIELEGAVRSNCLGWGMGLGLGGAGKRVASQNALTDIGVKNAPEWARANASAEAWRARYEALITNHESRRVKDRAPVATAARRIQKSAAASGRSITAVAS
jgi:hypothetical protein